MVELMCPAGNFESLMAAIKAGANSIYFGVGNLNMRARAAKFSIEDLSKISKICEENNVKSYLTLNTVVYNSDLNEIKKLCDLAKKHKISAIIAMDISVLMYAKKIGLEIHMSTQANISNIEAVKFYSQFADVIVLARELSLKQINEIILQIKKEKITGPNGKLIKVELFIHGALCVAISGKCYMSLGQYNYSANRGACLQSCRRKYLIKDYDTGKELSVENNYVMSPKDLSTIGMIDKLIKSGISIFKIEGRGRSADYVYTVTKTYKDAIKAVENGSYSKEMIESFKNNLKTVFNRGFWEDGYYLGKKLGDWNNSYGSKATKIKRKIGKILNYYKKANICQVLLQSEGVKLNDEYIITGETTGILKGKIESLYKFDSKLNKDIEVKSAKKGDEITFPVKEIVRKNDDFFILEDRSEFE